MVNLPVTDQQTIRKVLLVLLDLISDSPAPDSAIAGLPPGEQWECWENWKRQEMSKLPYKFWGETGVNPLRMEQYKRSK